MAVYFLFLSFHSLSLLVDMIHIGFLPDTRPIFLSIFFMIFCFYAALKGMKAIELTATVLAMFSLATGYMVTIAASEEKELLNLTPMLEYGFGPVLWGVPVLSSIWVELLLLLFLPMKDLKERRLLLFWNIGVLLNGLMMFSTMTGAVMVFGLGQADEFTYPALQTVRIISLGFLDRFDIYGITMMSIGCYLRVALYLRLAYQLLVPSGTVKKRREMLLFGALSLLVLALGVYTANEHNRVLQTTYFYCWLILLYPLPFLLLALPKRNGKNQSLPA